MKTGVQGTFVISWAQTSVDGQLAAPLADVRAGAVWIWTGEAVRLDGPADVLRLAEQPGAEDLRHRASLSVRKLLGGRGAGWAVRPVAFDPPGLEAGFSVTDGRRCWSVTIIAAGPGREPLALFADDLPPRLTPLWVVSPADPLPAPVAVTDPPGGVICFTPGTLIQTESGPCPVETLQEGDSVQTKDCGCQPVLWIGRRRLTGARMFAMPQLRPVLLATGALRQAVPDAPLLVSPDHRILLGGPQARALFNTDEVLVAARDLLNDRSVTIAQGLRDVTYIHLLLPSHQIVFANQVETESFHPASAALDQMDPGQLAALEQRLTGVTADPHSYGRHARRVLTVSEAAILRHDLG